MLQDLLQESPGKGNKSVRKISQSSATYGGASLMETLKRYAFQESGDEKGAKEHRCDFKLIDKTRGTAAGYIAKYVAKNIDCEHVGDDLEGRPATESAKRVEAWSSTWRIRQFQQVGGPPVSVWRELRRIKHLPADAPSHLQRAHRAANKQIQNDGDETATVAWDAYCRAQGGVDCGRSPAIKLTTRETETLGRYGDATQPRAAGVETWGHHDFDADGLAQQPRHWQIESERRVWTIERAAVRRLDWRSFDAESAKPALPRTSVNNCTNPACEAAQACGAATSSIPCATHEGAQKIFTALDAEMKLLKAKFQTALSKRPKDEFKLG
ncbi:replication endonuclease [Paucibacter sp. DJ2R-2]|uniref:replication endonuclease n=1 Tax=Paucibacter sp. DJ2R-2 TaxID=2893558 RepID=UPI0021E3D0E3|nr:replication endonuclease [Paucibacter sp. DJ2R-2]MCV2420170.1 replication endonuclease [Paucibacter sp. DJ4R-1]MCV2436885.1 replication endonuclease [Paucibacter sp. DJ2R-2]